MEAACWDPNRVAMVEREICKTKKHKCEFSREYAPLQVEAAIIDCDGLSLQNIQRTGLLKQMKNFI